MSGRSTPDCGVAATGYICQNEPGHSDDRPEVDMVSSPGENCVICPECGRRAGGPDDEIPYSDEDPHDRPGKMLHIPERELSESDAKKIREGLLEGYSIGMGAEE